MRHIIIIAKDGDGELEKLAKEHLGKQVVFLAETDASVGAISSAITAVIDYE